MMGDDQRGAIGLMHGKGNEVLGSNLTQNRFVHDKSHMTWTWLKPGTPYWETSH
jgi:hypothetical protein